MNNPLKDEISPMNAPAIVSTGDEGASLMQIISRAASDPETDVTKLERLMSLYERVKSSGAEASFNSAMKSAQSEMSRISTDANNPQTKSKYASYGKLDMVLRPVYTRHGFSVSFDTGDGAPPDCVRILAYVAHQDGHTRTYRADLPSDGKGAKGGDVMTKTHATGAAFTYGMRYLLKMIFNVAIGENDTDGNGEIANIDDKQRDEILKLISDSDTETDKFCAAFQIDAVPDLPLKAYDAAKSMLLQKIVRKQGGPAA